MQVLEFKDWAGGLTEHDSPEPPNRSKIIENLVLDHDKRLIQRGGFELYTSTADYLGTHERTAKLVNFDNNSELLAVQNKKVNYVSAGAWAEKTGPTGNHAFPNNTAASLVSDTQWNHHVFLASDNGTDPVVKLYRDGSSNLQLRTAGLPTFSSTLTPNDGGLALAIALANDLRTKMIAHYSANTVLGVGNPSNGSTDHHYAHADLAAQAAAVTASIAATDITSLIALLNILRTQYSAHIGDAQKEDNRATPTTLATVPFRNYHMAMPAGTGYYQAHLAVTTNQPLYKFRHYLNFTIADPSYSIPSGTAIADVLTYVNDLRDKWNWHTYAPMTHYNAAYWQGSNYFTYLGSHATALARVEPYSWAQITPDYSPFIQFVKDLHAEFLAHRTNDMHMEHDTVFAPPSGVSTSPTDFWGTVTLLGWLAYGITYHALEADTTFCANGSSGYDANVTATTTSGTNTLTLSTGGAVANHYQYLRVVPLVGLLTTPFAWGLYLAQDQTKLYNVTASDTATPTVLTCANNFTTSQASKQFVLTARHYHMGAGAGSASSTALFNPREFAESFDQLDFTLTSAASLQGFANLAVTLAGYLKAHTIDKLTPVAAGGFDKLKINGQQYQLYSNSLATFSATGYNILVHAGMDNTNYATSAGLGGLYLSLNSAITTGNTAATQMAQTRFDTAPSAKSYNYKAVYKYTYYVGTTKFEDRGAPSETINVIQFENEAFEGSTEQGKYSTSIANLQSYTNAAYENFDTANIVKELYRTIGNGTSYFKLDYNGSGGEVSNATTAFTDYAVDSYLVDQLQLYTNGGLPENEQPPVASCVHVCGSKAYYVVKNKVFQSLPEDPDSVPSNFYVQFDEDIVGLSSCRSIVLAFSANKVYRLLGGFNDAGRGALDYEIIFDRTGAVSMNSLVKGDNGVFFAGKDGIYFTDGIQVARLSDLPDTFASYTSTTAKRKLVAGAYNPVTKRLYYTLHDNGSGYPDTIWVVHLNWGIIPDATPVTTFVGGFDGYTGFNPTALTIFNDQLHYGDADGYIFREDPTSYMDWTKNTGTASANWNRRALLWRWKSGYLDATSGDVRKYWERITTEFKQVTNLSVQIISDCDYGRITDNLPIIRSRKLLDWGDPKIDWTSSVYTAKDGSVIDEFRRFKANGSLRSNFRAIQMANAFCVIVKSGDMGTLTITGGNTATLTSLVATRKWPAYSVGYSLKINGVLYPVTSRTSDSVIVVSGTPANGVVTDWELWGYPKNECVRFMEFFVDFDMLGQEQKDYQGTTSSDGGQNA